MHQRFGGMQRNKKKEKMRNGIKYKKRSKKTKRLRITNESTDTLLERTSNEDEGNVT